MPRASADPARGAPLSPLDIALLRVPGASAVLLPWGIWPVKRDGGCWLGVSPLPFAAFQARFRGVASVVISGMIFTQMIRHFGPVRSTMITALVPGLSARGAVVFLDEPLTPWLLGGLAAVTAGILIGVRAVASETSQSVVNYDRAALGKGVKPSKPSAVEAQ